VDPPQNQTFSEALEKSGLYDIKTTLLSPDDTHDGSRSVEPSSYANYH